MKLSYSTLACPAWSWQHAVDVARTLNYDGIEWRLVDGKMIDSDFPPGRAREITAAVTAAGLAVPALDTSVQLTAPPGARREAMLDDVRRYLTLAGHFAASFLRVFAGTYAQEIEDAQAQEWTQDALRALQPALDDTPVRLAIELHDCGWNRAEIRGVTSSDFITELIDAVGTRSAGVQWDVGNSIAEGEAPETTWSKIAPVLTYLQIKDMSRDSDGHWRYVPMGAGELPLASILDLVRASGFTGWVSFEWEKWWHPEIAEAEDVLPGFVSYMRSGPAGR
ncbi:sugar phosphate isomerase/epimerase [Micromonospora sp. Llam0]|uniref:sugar phosphate isomerase/epimerase family protein n=1 Tax=Micromonospora sp. Llam0 TaxID=2485143 RepID=UPI000F94271B|nr:sugar phosphate isomerase/epimerase family protein [Micromonospora sp. Llam0]ROO60631.1 sugar phosphate isomerase/epimerase [Micromonospora sp. Llam0]